MSVDQPKKIVFLVYISGNIPTLPVGSAEIAVPSPKPSLSLTPPL